MFPFPCMHRSSIIHIQFIFALIVMIAYLSWCNTYFDQRDVILLHGIEWRRRRGNVPKLRSCRAVEWRRRRDLGGTRYRIGMYYTDSSMASGSKQDGLSHSIKVAILAPPRYSICLDWAYFYGKTGCGVGVNRVNHLRVSYFTASRNVITSILPAWRHE